MHENELSQQVIGLAINVHRQLGPGLLESVYEECLSYELDNAGLFFERQKPMPVIYDTIKLDIGFKLDLFVERQLILELKAVDALNDVHVAQTLTYLRLSNCRLGLLINFNVAVLTKGIRRIANGY
jgi:GxxExxY protein